MRLVIASVVGVVCCASVASAQHVARGVVYHDADGDGYRDRDERGIEGVGVSDGRTIVETDARGRYQLETDEPRTIFVIKPRGWMVPVDDLMLPRFYHLVKPGGSPDHLEYAGVPDTGPGYPDALDFPLTRQRETDDFHAIVFGDPQPYSIEQVNYFARDVVADVIDSRAGGEASFGISLGDLVGDDMVLYPPLNRAISRIGIPWFNVHGNHDLNFDVDTDELSDETYEATFGPPTYSFTWGSTHFVVLDNVVYHGQKPDGSNGSYHAELREDQLEYLRNDLARLDDDTPVVLCMHIPMPELRNKEALFEILGDRPHTFSMSAHWHRQHHFFFGEEDGWRGGTPHHHMVCATASGSWWQGEPDEHGIPHATMRDGKPNGWLRFDFDTGRVNARFFPARGRGGAGVGAHAMHIVAPDAVRAGEGARIVVNLYMGVEGAEARCAVLREHEILTTNVQREWDLMTPMRVEEMVDPHWSARKEREAELEAKGALRGNRLTDLDAKTPLFVADLPGDLEPGVYTILVHTRDAFGSRAGARHVLRVTE